MNMKDWPKIGGNYGYNNGHCGPPGKKDYARRESTQEDRRVNLINLTEKGCRAFDEHHKFHLALTEQMISVLAEEEIYQFLTILKKINSEIF